MDDQERVNLSVAIDNIIYRLDIIEAELGIENVYMDIVEANKILNKRKEEN